MDVQPEQADVAFVVTIIHQIGQWFWWLVTGGGVIIGGLIWQSAAAREKTSYDLADHSQRLEKHEGRIAALEAKHNDIAIKLGELPTRAELTDRFDRIDRRLDAVVSQAKD